MEASVFNLQQFCLHDGPGIRTSVFFSGCNLRCPWCANPECRLTHETRTLESLVEEVRRDKVFYDKSGGGVTMTGGEALLQAAFVRAFARALGAQGIASALETAGAVEPAVFQSVVREMAFVYLDCKHYDPQVHRRVLGRSNGQTLENLAWLVQSGVDYCIRIPVIPGFNDSADDAHGFGRLFRSCGVQRAELLPFHQYGEGKYQQHGLPYAYAGVPALHREDLQDYAAILSADVPQVILI